MARVTGYGRTWWGNAWVEALHRIDYNTNRLPRGKYYANTGRVKDVVVEETGEVWASVQGTRSRPYRVKIVLEHFNEEQEGIIKGIIAGDPSLGAELSLGRLPESIQESLESKDICLLPEAWDSIFGDCSCPDWANPCKHLAAVYYIIAGEVDKDPFLLFKMRGLKTGDLLASAGIATPVDSPGDSRERDDHPGADRPFFVPVREFSSSSPGVQAPFPCPGIPPVPAPSHPPAPGSPAPPSSHPPPPGCPSPSPPPGSLPGFPVDLSSLGEGREYEAVFALLQDYPLFYGEGDFKKLLLRAYENVARAVENQELVDNDYSFRGTEFTLLYPSTKKPGDFRILVSPPGMAGDGGQEKSPRVPAWKGDKMVLRCREGKLFPAGEVLDRFLALPQGLPRDKSSPGADFISAAAALAQALARSSSFIPEVRRTGGAPGSREGDSFIIVYRPLDRSPRVREALAYLSSLLPPGLVYASREQGILPGTAGAWEFLCIYLTHLVHRFSGIGDTDKVSAAFFQGKVYRPVLFEEQQTGKAISRWFSWLNLQPVHISPVLKILLPPPDRERFRLKIYVENKKNPLEPGLPLGKVFLGPGQIFGRPALEVQQEVARQMTVAGEHIPILKKLLKYKGTMQAKLTSPALVDILSRGQNICSLLDIKVILPRELEEMARPVAAIAARSRAKQGASVSYLNLQDLLEFSWQVSLGGNWVTREEFMELARSAQGIVEFRDSYVMLEPGVVKKIMARLEGPLPEFTSAEVLRASMAGEAEGVIFRPDEMLQKMMQDLVREEEVGPPGDLKARLRPYQQRGLSWLYANTVKGLGSCLADDMGLGKTVQVLALLLKLKEEGILDKPALLVCPTTLLGNWVKECKTFAPSLQVEVYHGSNRRLSSRGVDLLMTSYGILRRERDKFKRKKWGLVVVDEAQNIKNVEAKQTKAVKSLQANSYIAMSGTPVENRLTELWSIFDFINRGYLGSCQDFIKKVAVPVEKYRDQEMIRKLRQATAPFLLRRLKSDPNVIQDLPEKAVKNEYCYLSQQQAALYQEVTEAILLEIEQEEGIARKGRILKLITALKQICNHPVQFTKRGKARPEHSGKAEKALFLLGNILARGEKALLFTQYREMGALLEKLIQEEMGEKALFFHGGLIRSRRDRMVEEFQGNGSGAPFMIVSLKAGGSGLNLTAATNVIHYDLWWNPAVEDQATDRTYRIGQTRDVQVYRLISLGTFEEKIDEMLKAKKELASLAVTAGESRLSELSNQELRELFILE